MADSEQVKNQIRDYIMREFLPGESVSNVRDSLELRDSGILDSLSTLKLVSYVEETFNITVGAHEASSSFGTIQDIANLVEQKQ